MRWPSAAVACAAITCVGVSFQQLSAAPEPSLERALLNQYCVTCHNDRLKTGGLSLTAEDVDDVSKNVALWEKVVRKLQARAMPPPGPGRPRPDEASYNALDSHLRRALDRVAAEHPDPGPVDAFRRLNRTEYQNAIRDLLDLDVDTAALLPTDDSSHGFDNVNLGAISPTLLDRYLAAAQKISRLAVGAPVRQIEAHAVVLPVDLTQDEQLEQLPFGTRGGTVFRYTFPADAHYRFDIRLTRDRDEKVEGITRTQQIELALDGVRAQLFSVAGRPFVSPLSNAPQDPEGAAADAGLNARIPVKAGPHTIAVAFLKRPSALAETERQPFKASYNGRTQAAIFSVTIVGPYDTGGAGDTPSRRRIFTCRPEQPADDEVCARKILSTLARRAYRRAVAASDVDDLMKFYQEGRVKGPGFEAGIEMALRALLVSPRFLLRIEQEPAPNRVAPVSDVELASRLSFFLWSSLPDDELLDLAIAGRLSSPAELDRQVRRLLSDPRSDALVKNFAGQWLYLRNVQEATRDPRLFPDFDDNLRQSFRRETELFFESIVREDRSVLDLLRANYTFTNERLARHYGIPNVYGSHFRRVTFDEGSVRGGLLGQGSILMATSYANRTSPVQRGKWVLENVLGMPPPPPPGIVPPLKEAAPGKVLTMRERMMEHRSNAVCSSCHQIMDPIGLATENFDAVGRWRTVGESGEVVDASGGLPDGSTFSGAVALREALLRHSDLFVATTTEKLLTYALGRGLEPTDGAAVRAILEAAAPSEYRFSAIVAGIVNSTPFRLRRSQ